MNLLELRERIRGGSLQREQQIAIAGTELWKPAWQYPPLERYFALADQAVAKHATPVAGPAEGIGARIVRGLVYPFTNIAAIVFIVAAAFTTPVQIISSLIAFVAMGYALAIIRKSSEGGVTAPSISEIGGAGEWIMGLLRSIVISIISAWPVILVGIMMVVGFRAFILVPVALIVMLLYYPACLASIALWKELSIALSVSRIFAFIGVLGADYFAAVAVTIFTMVLIAAATTFGPLAMPVLLVRVINNAATVWVLFYASHLLGWAVFRHRDEVGL